MSCQKRPGCIPGSHRVRTQVPSVIHLARELDNYSIYCAAATGRGAAAATAAAVPLLRLPNPQCLPRDPPRQKGEDQEAPNERVPPTAHTQHHNPLPEEGGRAKSQPNPSNDHAVLRHATKKIINLFQTASRANIHPTCPEATESTMSPNTSTEIKRSPRSPKRMNSSGRNQKGSRLRHQKSRRFRATADGTCALCQNDLVPNDPAGVFRWACGNHLTHKKCAYDMIRGNHFKPTLPCPICRESTDWTGQINVTLAFDLLLQSITNHPPGAHTILLTTLECVDTSPTSDDIDLLADAISERRSVEFVEVEDVFEQEPIFLFYSDRTLTVDIGPYHTDVKSVSGVKYDLLMQRVRLRCLMDEMLELDDFDIALTVSDSDANLDYGLFRKVLVRHESFITAMMLEEMKQRITIPPTTMHLTLNSFDPQHLIRMGITQTSDNTSATSNRSRRRRSKTTPRSENSIPRGRFLHSLSLINMTCANRNDHNDPNLFFPKLKMLQGITDLSLSRVSCDSHITQQLTEVIQNVKVSNFSIHACTFRDENNVSCIHVLLTACLAKNKLRVFIRDTDLGPKYPRSFIWPQRWQITRHAAPPRRSPAPGTRRSTRRRRQRLEK